MIGELFSNMFRFKNLGSLDRSIIAVAGLSVVLVTLILFLIRYCFNYGILRVFGMSLICGAIWALTASAVVTAFNDKGRLYVLLLGSLMILWGIIILIIVIKKPYFKGMTKCAISAFIFFALAIVICIPVKAAEEQIANFANGLLVNIL